MTDREKLIERIEHAEGMVNNDVPTLEQIADHLIANGVTIQSWIPVMERLPDNFVSVLGYMTDAGDFPPVRECYTVGNAFFFPALGDIHPVTHWMPLPKPPKEVDHDS